MTQPVSAKNEIDVARSALQAALADRASVDLSWIQPPPNPESWTLSSDAIRFLVALVQHVRPRHVLEFGAGLSTRVLSHVCAQLQPPAAVSSVDHDPDFARKVQRDPDCAKAFVQVAPLVVRDVGGRPLPLYDVKSSRFASRRPADLAIIDGPPVLLGGREGTLYEVMDYARRGTIVLLDDAHRDAERAVLERWREDFGDRVEIYDVPVFSRGLAAIIVREPVRREDLWTWRRTMAARDIESVVPAGQPFILVDDGQWGTDLVSARRVDSFACPENDEDGIRELERLRSEGAAFLVFGSPSFWWLDFYAGLSKHICSRYPSALSNSRVVAFDLRRGIP